MTSRPLPKPKKSTSSAQTRTTVMRQRPRIERIVHELINQLTVLNLIGFNVISKNDTRFAPTSARDREIIQNAIHEATSLAEQLALCVASTRQQPSSDRSTIMADAGQVVRLLRSVARSDR